MLSPRSTKREYPLLAMAAALAFVTAGCGRGADDGMTHVDPTVNAIHAVSSRTARDADGRRIGSWWLRTVHPQGRHDTLTHTHRDGDYANVIVSYDDNEQLQFHVLLRRGDYVSPMQKTSDFEAQAHRYIDTHESYRDLRWLTSYRRLAVDGNSRSGWQAEELTNDYDNGGTLRIYIATDAQPSDMATDLWQTATEFDGTIRLSGVAPHPADRDYMVVALYDGHGIDGTLNDVSGRFSCANPSNCDFVLDHTGEYRPFSAGISFTPTGGAAQALAQIVTGPEARADYLSFGHWLHVPEDAARVDVHDLGVFASGGDPFDVPDLSGLTGTATYEGRAAGMYFVDRDTASPIHGAFTAQVTLTADFGDGVETGTVRGSVTDFDWPAQVAAALPAAVRLTSDNFSGFPAGYGHSYTADEDGLVRGESNIFDTLWHERDAWRGGHVLGVTEADVEGTEWWGHWQAAFFGNGAAATDHPTSMAGTFTAADQTTGGLAGGFGAKRQRSTP